ncbi:beta-barrel assembly-enhancing protease [Desulfogranum mediterraneum]|uniref:beta-barrel assembly-enhancing protease n=1 Tax=Desulfogranum mediterraneum TaxID=160661 RepID=UPI000420EEF1|nr:M48 family metallopeptidase [Desulfogranum mediterraneum]
MNLGKSLQHFCCWFAILAVCLLPIQASALSIGEERLIGERLLYSVRGEFPVLDDPDIHHYINELGQQVLTAAGPQFFDYHFYVVLSPQFNAFAAPAGLVFFYTGLIETMKNEDQLLSVLAHEIGHVVSRHIAQRLDKGGKISATTMALALASLALGIPALSQGIFAGSLAAGQALQLHYSRNDEEQADRLSFQWMQEMHRNPEAMEGMLSTMRRITRYRSGKLPQYLLTHPNPEARLDYVQSMVALDDKQQGSYYQPTDNFAFFRFQFRVLQRSMDHEDFRVYCVNAMDAGQDKTRQLLAHFGMALVESEELNLEQAMAHLHKVKAAYPGEGILDIDQAVILADNQRLAEAREILERVVRRDPEDLYGVYQLGLVEYRLGELSAAEQRFKKVAKELPEYAQVYYEQGRVAAALGSQEVSRYYLGLFNLYTGKTKVAKQYLRKAAKDQKVPEELRDQAQQILDKLKKLEKAT